MADGRAEGTVRAGADLVRATKPYSEEHLPTTWRLFAVTMAVFGSLEAVALLAPWPVLNLAAGVLAGLVFVRIFIFYHDWLHGAIFRGSRLGGAVMQAYGWLCLAPAPVWAQTHDYHHRNNAKMLGASIGSYPTVSVNMWRVLTPSQRFWYKFARSPLTILFGYFTVFVAGMCLSAFVREPRTHWQNLGALVLHAALFTVTGVTLGLWPMFAGVFVPLFLGCAAGSYLFYAQHNFPDCELRSRDSWSYHHAALKASSMFDMPAPMHWLTGNIGYHHVHHLNHKIPFYRLPEAMAAMPELQSPGRTTWWPRDVLACLRLKLWDPDRNRLIGWDELPDSSASRPAGPAEPAAAAPRADSSSSATA